MRYSARSLDRPSCVEVLSRRLPRFYVGAEPVGEPALVERSSGHVKHEPDDLGLLGDDPPAVEAEEDIHRLKGHALVAVHKRVVARESEAVGGREVNRFGIGLVVPAVAGPCKRGMQKVVVAQPDRAAVLTNLVRMDRTDERGREPARLRPLCLTQSASSRMAFR